MAGADLNTVRELLGTQEHQDDFALRPPFSDLQEAGDQALIDQAFSGVEVTKNSHRGKQAWQIRS
jgi:hypothetical protein